MARADASRRRCAIYTRKSSEEGLEQEFNSLAAQREATGERSRDKIAASKKKGMWMGGNVPLGYDASERTLVINPAEAETVRRVFALYRELGCVRRVKEEADRLRASHEMQHDNEWH